MGKGLQRGLSFDLVMETGDIMDGVSVSFVRKRLMFSFSKGHIGSSKSRRGREDLHRLEGYGGGRRRANREVEWVMGKEYFFLLFRFDYFLQRYASISNQYT